jgi:DNA-binding NarL/FixJ family response regulator
MAELRPPGDIVLIVDDSPETLGFLNEALAAAGMSVLVATGGAEALDLLGNITPDVVLMDAVMPGVDGFAACRAIKANLAMCDVPVIFMTGLSDPEHVLEGFAAGGIDYVTKPVDCDVLIARIRAHLAVARLAQDARKTLDSAGQHVIAMRRQGQIVWSTPLARALCAKGGIDDAGTLPDALREAARSAGGRPVASDIRWIELGDALEFKVAGVTPADDILVLLRERRGDTAVERFRQELGVTPREADVLLWICRGKTNRDIAEILEMSPRTVDKHLEQIYAKLGVENRTSAASIGLALLDRNV